MAPSFDFGIGIVRLCIFRRGGDPEAPREVLWSPMWAQERGWGREFSPSLILGLAPRKPILQGEVAWAGTLVTASTREPQC